MSQDGNDLLGPLIMASIGKLVPSAGVGDPAKLLAGLECMMVRVGVDNGAKPHYLDEAMLKILEKDSEWYAGKVEKGGFYKWQEENKALTEYLAWAATTAAYAAIMYANAKAQQSRAACFVSGTKIMTANGHVPIECIQAGDYVYSENVGTGEKGLKRVAQTFIRETNQLVHIHVDGQKIITTPEHPFYLSKKGWIAAKQLRARDKLLLRFGKEATIGFVRHESLAPPVTVYNFEVEDWHTYYVSEIGVLVHNSCKPGTPSRGRYPDQKIRSDRSYVKSERFIEFLRSKGFDPSKWWKVMETWRTPDGYHYERHYWTNGTQSYYYEDIWYID